MEAIFRKILSKNRVSIAEYKELMEKVRKVLDKLDSALKKNRLKAEMILGGSFAKGTILRGDFDCDVFVRFDKKYKDAELSDRLEKALCIFKDIDRVHGSRDYFQLLHDGIMFEFVPVVNINYPGEARNVTDISPLHVDWIRKKIARNPDLKNDILLAKLFCKAQNIYGAESYIAGFSGHVLDILISYFGSFNNLLENAKYWQKYKVIDVERHDSVDEMNKSKLSPLIVVDPIQKDRNAAAALNIEKFIIFRKRAAEFLKKPSESFFKQKRLSDSELKKAAGKDIFILFKVRPLDGKRDVVGSKLLKVFNHINRHLALHDFEVRGSGWDWNRKSNGNDSRKNKDNTARMWFYIKIIKLSTTKIVEGPPLEEKLHVERFRSVHENTYNKRGRVYARVCRVFLEPKALVKKMISGDFVKERVESIRVS